MALTTRLSFALALLTVGVGSSAQAAVLGKLGQALTSARIHASPSARARVYYTVRTYEYLVINNTRKAGWRAVYMNNGAYGYVKEDAVAELPYNVVTKSRTVASNGGSGRIAGSQTARGAVADYGLNFIGTPYQWGGNDVMNGIDCSAFVKQMYGKIGIQLPRTAAQQAMVGQSIGRLEDLQKGDRLYFWDHKRGKIGHTGLYLGNGYFVHSSSGRRGVATDYLGQQRWLKILVAARR